MITFIFDRYEDMGFFKPVEILIHQDSVPVLRILKEMGLSRKSSHLLDVDFIELIDSKNIAKEEKEMNTPYVYDSTSNDFFDYLDGIITYGDLQDLVVKLGGMIECCYLNSDYIRDNELELESGRYAGLLKDPIHNMYIISRDAAEVLKNTPEMVYYIPQLGLYAWALRESGTNRELTVRTDEYYRDLRKKIDAKRIRTKINNGEEVSNRELRILEEVETGKIVRQTSSRRTRKRGSRNSS